MSLKPTTAIETLDIRSNELYEINLEEPERFKYDNFIGENELLRIPIRSMAIVAPPKAKDARYPPPQVVTARAYPAALGFFATASSRLP
jgi:hypothetical protein